MIDATSRLNRTLLAIGVAPLALSVALAAPAFAQDAASTVPQTTPTAEPTPTTSGPIEGAALNEGANGRQDEIVVTGSRIARPELESATPVAVVGSDEIRRQGATNIQDVLAKLPQVGIPGLSNTNSNFLTADNGVATIDLRNLGDSRTLVLVNGRRFVPGVAGTSIVDVNDIPADFIDRVEVVTGGASSIYGSDAIAGVVNFVLKDSFEGVTARAQTGLTYRYDNPKYNASITGGLKFGPEGRGAILGNVTYDKDTGLYSRERKISKQDCSTITTPNDVVAGCGPQSYSSYPAQGRFQLTDNGAPAGNGGGYASNLFTFNPDNSLVTGFPTGYGFNRNSLRRISTPVEREIVNALGHYDLTDNVTAFFEGTYVHVKSSSQIEPYALDSGTDLGFGYAIDNPFIPDAIKAEIAARNSDADPSNDVDQISFRRRQNDVFSRSNNNRRNTYRFAGGLRGTIADKFKWEASYVYGELKDHTYTQDINTARLAEEVDAVQTATGPQCRINVDADSSNDNSACTPINFFGYNTVSPEAAAYVQTEPRSDRAKNTEQVASANITGPLFALPGGDLQVSLGAEYRREKSVDNWDATTNAGENTGNQISDTIGKYNVKEVFGEVDVPLLKDRPFFYSLSAQGAARYSDYSTIGHVFSWNAGGEWAPVNGIRFRGNYAVANRAPNISELYSPPSETFPSVQDPCDGVTASSSGTYDSACRAIPAIAKAIANGGFNYTLADIQGINGFDGGNVDLQEEKGRTITAGVALTPSFFRGFSLTVDYFHIKIDNAIGTVDRATSIQQCLATGLPQFCDNVIRDPNTGFIKTVNAQSVNIASLKTSGLDFDVRYGHALGLVPNDRLDFNALYTHTINYKTQSDPSAPVDSGVGNLEYGEVFKDKVTGRLSYTVGPVSLSWSTTYLSHMHDQPVGEFNDYGATGDPAIDEHNNIKARFYHDVSAKVDVGTGFEIFGGVDNLFNRKPPILEDTEFYGTITGTTTAADVYDPFGRRFYIGAQVHF